MLSTYVLNYFRQKQAGLWNKDELPTMEYVTSYFPKCHSNTSLASHDVNYSYDMASHNYYYFSSTIIRFFFSRSGNAGYKKSEISDIKSSQEILVLFIINRVTEIRWFWKGSNFVFEKNNIQVSNKNNINVFNYTVS